MLKTPYVSALLVSESVKITAKVLWLLGETGLKYPSSIQGTASAIAAFCDVEEYILRERAITALGRNMVKVLKGSE